MAAAAASGKDEESDSKNGVRIHSVRLTLPKDTIPGTEAFEGLRKPFDDWIRKTATSWTYQCEDPTKNLQNVHFQAYIRVDPKVRSEQLRTLLWLACTNRTPAELGLVNVSPASKEGQTALKKYCMKDASRIAGPWHDSDGPVPLKVLDEKQFHQWQKEMNDWVSGEPDDRSIIWVTDMEGGHGKTQWARWQFIKNNACVIRYAKFSDMVQVIASNKHRRTYIFDLSRTKPSDFKMDDLHSLCEALKDGLITVGKYQSTSWAQNTAHVIVLSNFPPTKGVFSADRLQSWTLENGLLIR